MRVFLAISLPQELRENFSKIREKLNKVKGLKLVEPENLHLTLKFLGEIPEEKTKKVSEELKKISGKKFPLKLKGIGVFPNPNYMRVIWVGVEESQEVENLQREIEKALFPLGFKKETKFHPHFTLARVKKISPDEKEKLKKILKEDSKKNFGQFQVNSIEVMRSQLTPKGPLYSTLKKIKLL